MLALTYSPLSSTIGAGGLNFRVRNENGCDPAAKAPAQRAQSVSDKFYLQVIKFQVKRTISRFPNESGRISTPRLNTLLHFHLAPINVIISHGSHNDF